uniref:Uncharacterized protein n=1 Tax=Romanomermis culicivorax TaxID=13658 RepID=A0A915IGH3_ROMCU
MDDQERPQEIIIANSSIATKPAIGSEGATQGEKLMEVLKTAEKRSTELNVLMYAVKIMKEKIKMLEEDCYEKEAIEPVKKI